MQSYFFPSRHWKDVKYSEETLTSELRKHMIEKVESQQRIKRLESDVKRLSDRKKEENVELERQVFAMSSSIQCKVLVLQ